MEPAEPSCSIEVEDEIVELGASSTEFRESLSSFDDTFPLLATSTTQRGNDYYEHPFTMDIILRFCRNKANLNSIFLCISILVGLLVFILPPPDGLSGTALDSLGIFVAVMICIMTTSFSMSIITSLALAVLVLTKSLECELETGEWIDCRDCAAHGCNAYELGFKSALQGFSNPIAWMILSAFHLGFAVQKTHLGKRISLLLMKYMGKTLLSLGYAIFFSELILAPFIPSNTARGGGLVLPIVMSLINTLDATPTNSKKDIGEYLILCGAHANLLISSMFITGAAPNPIVVGTALKILDIQISFTSWTLGALVPAGLSIAVLPMAFKTLSNPDYDGIAVKEEAEKQLQTLGPMSLNEIKLLCILSTALVLWISGEWTGIPETFVAFLALVFLLILEVLSWIEVSSNALAWDTFYWLSGMLVLAEQLSKLGVSHYIGSHVAFVIAALTSNTLVATLLLGAFYFASMILFSSITGHAVALVGPFLSAGRHLGSPPYLSTLLMAYFSTLSACFTHFSTGSMVLYYSQGFISQSKWWAVGLGVALSYLTVYYTFGLLWFKMIGYF